MILYVETDPDANFERIHLGYRLGRNKLFKHLTDLKEIGVNHVFFNLKYSKRPADEVLEELRKFIVPYFPPLEI